MHVAFGVFLLGVFDRGICLGVSAYFCVFLRIAGVFLRVRRKSRKARKTQRTRNEEIFFGQHPSRTKGSVEVRGAFSAFSAFSAPSAIQTGKRSELPT